MRNKVLSTLFGLFVVVIAEQGFAEESTMSSIHGHIRSIQKKEFKRSKYEWCKSKHRGFFDETRSGSAGTFCDFWDESSEAVCPGVMGWCEQDQALCSCNKELDAPKLPSFDAWSDFSIPGEVFWLIAGFVGLILGLVIFRSYFGSNWRLAGLIQFDPLSEIPTFEELNTLPETETSALLGQARARLQHQPKEAALLVHFALLKFLDGQGLAAFHPSRTNGDYLRRLRKKPEAQSLYRRVSGQTDRIRFDDGLVDQELLRILLHETETFTRKTFGATRPESGFAPISSLFPFVIVFAASAFGNAACGEAPTLEDSFPSGFSALPALLKSEGFKIKTGVFSSNKYGDPGETVVFVNVRSQQENAVLELPLKALLDQDRSVVIMDEWRMPSLIGALGGRELCRDPPRTGPRIATLVSSTTSVCRHRLAGLQAAGLPTKGGLMLPSFHGVGKNKLSFVVTEEVEFDFVGNVKADAFLIHKTDSATSVPALGLVMNRQEPGASPLPGCLFYFPDSVMFQNGALLQTENLQYVLAFFESINQGKEETIHFVVKDGQEKTDSRMTGENRDIWKILSEAKLLPIAVHALIILAALMLLLGLPFGRLRDSTSLQHRSFMEHVTAIGQHYASNPKQGPAHASKALAQFFVALYLPRKTDSNKDHWDRSIEQLAEAHDLGPAQVRAVLRLGLENSDVLGPRDSEEPEAHSELIMTALRTLLGKKQKE
jgi:hypothetical protein